MSIGLIALLDDIAALAKVAAASLDDIAGQAAKAGAKAAGVVIDDAAVTPRYVVGFAAERELPIVGKIALGSLRNKLLFLLPAALALSAFAPWAITPLLMLGGAYLCYEGAEKVYEALFPHQAHAHEADARAGGVERQGAGGPEGRGRDQDRLHPVGRDHGDHAGGAAGGHRSGRRPSCSRSSAIGITVAVYGGVALIVKADDVGVALAAQRLALGLRRPRARRRPRAGLACRCS